jgi:arginine exporter protein ArgO
MNKIMIFILFMGLIASLSAQNIPSNLSNATSTVDSLPKALAYTFLNPVAPITLILIAFGIAYVRTNKIRLGLTTALIMSLLLFTISYKLYGTLTNAEAITGGIALFTAISILADLIIKRQSKH